MKAGPPDEDEAPSRGAARGAGVAGIDLGGTQVRMAFADETGLIVANTVTETATLGSPENVANWAAEQVRRHGEPVRSVAIGAPGPIDPARRVLVNPPNLAHWLNVPLASVLEAAVACPVHLENDANLAALAEFHKGAGRGASNLVYITWGTGVGGGLILDGRLYTGTRGLAGELGHMIVAPGGPVCGCGQHGCLEAVCGGANLARQTGRSAVELFAAARVDREALAIVQRAAASMGQALVTLTNIFDPDLIVIGGGVTSSWELIEPEVTAVLRASPFIRPERQPPLRRTQLNGDAGLVGAVEWARINLR